MDVLRNNKYKYESKKFVIKESAMNSQDINDIYIIFNLFFSLEMYFLKKFNKYKDKGRTYY